MSQGAYAQEQQQQVGDYYACAAPQPTPCAAPPPQPACPPSAGVSSHVGFHVGLPGNWSSRRCEGTPAYTVCEQPPAPCVPQQVCEQIGGEMQAAPQGAAPIQQPMEAQQQQQQQQQFVQGHYGAPQPQYYAPPPMAEASGTKDTPILDLTHKDNRSTRRLVIQITGSLAAFQGSPNLARWTLTNEDILKRKIDAAVGAQRHGDLQKTVVLDARVLFTSSNCPKSLVAQCSAFRGNTYTDGGVRGFMYIPEGKYKWSGEDGRGIRVMRPNVMVRSTLMSTYGHLDEDSLRAPLTKVKGTDFHMVPRGHEIMRIIELNAQKLGLDLGQYQTVCGDQYPVVDKLVANCIGQIKKQVLNLKPWSDMSKGKLVVSLVPADARAGTNSWAATRTCPGIGQGFVPDRISTRVLNTPIVIEIWLSLTYAIADRVFVGGDVNKASGKAQ